MYYYIVNPASGNGAIDGLQDKLKATLRELKIDGEFAKTLGPGDAAKITSDAISKGAKTLVAVGGSNTVNEVINAVYKQKNSDVAIGMIPIGKNNTLANALGITSWRQGCDALASRRLIEYSLLAVNDYVSVQSLIVTPPLEEQDADEEPPTGWRRFLSRKPATPDGKLIFKADLDGNLKLRGTASQLAVYNQKFLYPELDNQVLIQTFDQPQSAENLLSKVGLKMLNQPDQPNASQLHSSQIKLRLESLASGNLDGKIINTKQFDISLTEWRLRMVTNLPVR